MSMTTIALIILAVPVLALVVWWIVREYQRQESLKVLQKHKAHMEYLDQKYPGQIKDSIGLFKNVPDE